MRLALRSAFTTRSVVSPDLEYGRRRITKDLVLDRHRRESALASRSIGVLVFILRKKMEG
jgi:hypothetical protein